MIKVERAAKYFGKTKAVDDISFDVEAGENVVLLGTSGCGKTTTLRLINRLLELSSGSIYVSGKNITEVSPEQLRRNIGYVLQHNGLFPHYTIAENIAVVPHLLKWPKNKINNRVEELLEQLSLPKEYASLYPKQLSGGQQQRVGLARGLAANPDVLLMDEPFGALDAVTRGNITREFAQLEVLQKKTIVLVTHDINEAFNMGDKILLMDKGKIVQAGSPTELLFKPANEFVSAFFKSQQMQLELYTVLLKDIWPQLSKDKFSGETVKQINDGENIWNGINLLSDTNATILSVKNSETGEIRYAEYNLLFNALTILKQNA